MTSAPSATRSPRMLPHAAGSARVAAIRRTYPWLVTPISHGEILELAVASAAWTSLISGGIASVQKSPMASRSALYAGQTRRDDFVLETSRRVRSRPLCVVTAFYSPGAFCGA